MPQQKVKRSPSPYLGERLAIRLSKAELDRLRQLAAFTGYNVSETARAVINEGVAQTLRRSLDSGSEKMHNHGGA
jgi:hypothetical protein